jgi:hypothetical protein
MPVAVDPELISAEPMPAPVLPRVDLDLELERLVAGLFGCESENERRTGLAR